MPKTFTNHHSLVMNTEEQSILANPNWHNHFIQLLKSQLLGRTDREKQSAFISQEDAYTTLRQ